MIVKEIFLLILHYHQAHNKKSEDIYTSKDRKRGFFCSEKRIVHCTILLLLFYG